MNDRNSKYKKNTTVYSDYYLEPGQYEKLVISKIIFLGSEIMIYFDNKTYKERLILNIKTYNKLFLTKNEIRLKKLNNLENL